MRRWSISPRAALPMVLWSVLVDKVHRNPSTGIDWANRQAMARDARRQRHQARRAVGDLGRDRAIYAIGRFYWEGNFRFAMWCFTRAAPVLFVASIPYMLWLDRCLVEPKDGCWHLGAWLMGRASRAQRSDLQPSAQLGR